ncbi:hypothetical protein SFUMM280S_01164 [Streptomyces fumanus]
MKYSTTESGSPRRTPSVTSATPALCRRTSARAASVRCSYSHRDAANRCCRCASAAWAACQSRSNRARASACARSR